MFFKDYPDFSVVCFKSQLVDLCGNTEATSIEVY